MALDPKTHLIYLGTAKFETAAGETGGRRARPKMTAGTYQILVIGR
jgi:hypothetical protein